MKYVIIEDEPLMAADLAADVASLRPAWECQAQLRSVRQAVAWLREGHAIDLIFSDIQLGDGTCFDVFAAVKPSVPVIFCTAYDQYALQAFEANGVGYLLKPFGMERLRAAVERLEQLRPAVPDLSGLMALLQPARASAPARRVLVHHKDKVIPIELADVAIFYTHHEITHLRTLDGHSYTLPQGLGEVEALAGADFFRASRQHLVQRKAIVDATQYFARKLLLNLTVPFEEQVTVSKEKVPAFLEWLERG